MSMMTCLISPREVAFTALASASNNTTYLDIAIAEVNKIQVELPRATMSVK